MSTRCHIVVKNTTEKKENYVYHHWDGYINGVGKELKEFIKDKYEPSIFSADEFCKQLENWDCSYEYENCGIHGDEEYIYYVDINSEEQAITLSVKEKTVSRIYDENNKTKIVGWDSKWNFVDDYMETFKK